LAARSENFTSSLRKAGLDVSDTLSLREIVGALTDTIDARLGQNGGRTDLGEMAQMAAAETISKEIGGRTQSLGSVKNLIANSFSSILRIQNHDA